jgi:hypothetical protein
MAFPFEARMKTQLEAMKSQAREQYQDLLVKLHCDGDLCDADAADLIQLADIIDRKPIDDWRAIEGGRHPADIMEQGRG